MNSIWGFGGVKFYVDEGNDYGPVANFYGNSSINSTADGRIIYKPIYIRKENISNKIIEKFLGYRVEIEIEILNILPNDGTQLSQLITALNNVYSHETYRLGINVNRKSDDSGGIFYSDMVLMGDISFEQLHKLEIGQKIKLKFARKAMIGSISTMVRDRTVNSYNLVDENGDKIWDENADNDNEILIQNY